MASISCKKEESSEYSNSVDPKQDQHSMPKFIIKMARLHSDATQKKPFKCPIENCSKSYKHMNGIRYHAIHGHTNEKKEKKLAQELRHAKAQIPTIKHAQRYDLERTVVGKIVKWNIFDCPELKKNPKYNKFASYTSWTEDETDSNADDEVEEESCSVDEPNHELEEETSSDVEQNDEQNVAMESNGIEDQSNEEQMGMEQPKLKFLDISLAEKKYYMDED